jgi:hypothetical protein
LHTLKVCLCVCNFFLKKIFKIVNTNIIYFLKVYFDDLEN